MPDYVYFKTDKEQFVVPVWAVIPHEKAHLLPSKHDQEIVAKQPLKEGRDFTRWSTYKGYGILDLATASNFLKSEMLSMTEKDLRDMLDNTDLIRVLKTNNNPSYKKIMQVKKRLKDGTFTINTFDPLSDFAEKKCVALFCTMKDGTEGYVQKSGSLGPLSKALLFESERDARASVNRQSIYYSYDGLQLVNLSVSVESLGERIENTKARSGTDFNKTSIFGVGALATKKKIQDALKHASLDQLAEAYKQLTGESWGEIKQEAPKRKM